MIKYLDGPQYINFSTKHNCFVLTPPKTGSRNLTRILKHLDFHTYGVDGERFVYLDSQPTHNHTVSFMENHLDHEVMISCRNPYAIYCSMFRLKTVVDRKIRSTFNLQKEYHEYLLQYLHYDMSDPWRDNSGNHFIEKLLSRKIDHRIKLENFSESVLNVPFIKNLPSEQIQLIRDLSLEKFGDYSEMKVFNFAKKYFPSDFRLYYNQEIADLVYENFKGKFAIMGYDKDSWKL
jgi:hypothetical protein